MDAIDFDAALSVATAYVGRLSEEVGAELQTVSEHTRQFSQGWLFFYDTPEAIRTQDPLHGLLGNAPFFVSKDEGGVIQFPGDRLWQQAMSEFGLS